MSVFYVAYVMSIFYVVYVMFAFYADNAINWSCF